MDLAPSKWRFGLFDNLAKSPGKQTWFCRVLIMRIPAWDVMHVDNRAQKATPTDVPNLRLTLSQQMKLLIAFIIAKLNFRRWRQAGCGQFARNSWSQNPPLANKVDCYCRISDYGNEDQKGNEILNLIRVLWTDWKRSGWSLWLIFQFAMLLKRRVKETSSYLSSVSEHELGDKSFALC
jgi:hypothetical protein